MKAIEKIEQQQKKLKEGTAPWCVGEQLKEICRREPRSAELVEKDLDVPEMSLKMCEAKIKEWADKHRSGNFAFVSPGKAEEIIREFYGLTETGLAPHQPLRDSFPSRGSQGERRGRVIDLGDFL